MHNIRFHLINIAAVTFFAYALALSINSVVRFSITNIGGSSAKTGFSGQTMGKAPQVPDYQMIVNSGFFKVATVNPDGRAAAPEAIPLSDIKLFGTITGPPVIARALIAKAGGPAQPGMPGQNDPKAYKIGQDVFGYKLIQIDNSRIFLRIGKQVKVIDMFIDTKDEPASAVASVQPGGSQRYKQNISRTELQQKILNNMDNALTGLRAGPYRVNGQITGFKLFRVAPDTVLYKLGARDGDVIKRINGHPIDSTEKLYRMWQGFPTESRIVIDLERSNQIVTYDLNVTE